MKRRLALGTLSVLVVLAAACSTGSHLASKTKGTGTSTSVTAAPSRHTPAPASAHHSTTATTKPAPPTTQPAPTTSIPFGTTDVKGITVLNQQGTGNESSSLFTVPVGTTQWDLTWSYSCPSTAVTSSFSIGRFVFDVYRYNSEDRKDPGNGGGTDSGQGTQHYSDTGTFSIHVGALSSCLWSLIAVLPTST